MVALSARAKEKLSCIVSFAVACSDLAVVVLSVRTLLNLTAVNLKILKPSS